MLSDMNAALAAATPGGAMGGEMLRRQRATSATMAKFRAKPHSWKAGHTCVHLARFHLKALGHKPAKLPRINSLLSAKRALAARGWADTAAMLDAQSYLTRIPPAMALLGDIAVAPSEDGIGAILVCVETHVLIGWHDDAEGMVAIDIPPGDLLGMWRA